MTLSVTKDQERGHLPGSFPVEPRSQALQLTGFPLQAEFSPGWEVPVTAL